MQLPPPDFQTKRQYDAAYKSDSHPLPLNNHDGRCRLQSDQIASGNMAAIPMSSQVGQMGGAGGIPVLGICTAISRVAMAAGVAAEIGVAVAPPPELGVLVAEVGVASAGVGAGVGVCCWPLPIMVIGTWSAPAVTSLPYQS